MAQLSFLTYLRGIYKLNLTKSGKVHDAIIQSIYDCFVMTQGDIDLMRLEMCLSTATGYWLDYWGSFFSVNRKFQESDDHYSKRIISTIIKPKTTIPSIKEHLVEFLNEKHNEHYTPEDIVVKEPWRDLSKYSHQGVLSSDSRFASEDYYCHAVLDISIPESITEDVVELVKSIKAAGVQVVWSILNSYDIITGFHESEDNSAAYLRHIQTTVTDNQYFGLVLSNSSSQQKLSGTQRIWSYLESNYYFYVKVRDKSTDDSIILTKYDLIGLLTYFMNEGSYTKITDEILKSLEDIEKFMRLDHKGIMSGDAILWEQVNSHKVFQELMDALELFKKNNPEYWDAVQPPILNGERATWLIERNKNWLWETPTLTHEDLFKYYEPCNVNSDYKERTFEVMVHGEPHLDILVGNSIKHLQIITGHKWLEHTLNSIIEFEDAYEKGYITFGDMYQPPIEITSEKI